jgi:hypothetical protein
MDNEQVDELMRENGIVVVGEAVYILCNLVEEQSAAAEREACIKLLEDFSKTTMVPVVDTWRMGLIAGANALRARGLQDMNKQAEQNGEEL